MSVLVRGSDLVGLPVVTLGGDDAAEVRDVLFDPGAGLVLGFTLNKRGFLAGRLKEVLPRTSVLALGPDAVMVQSADAFAGTMPAETPGGAGDVLGDRVLTDAGSDIGTVTDVVVDTADGRVVGYEIAPADEGKGRKGRRSYVPLVDAGTASGDTLIVPAAALDYMSSDLAGFGEAVDRFRAALPGRRLDGPAVRLSEFKKHQVVDLGTATTVALISDVGVDAATRRVTGFALRKTPGQQNWLPWERLKALGPDAATVEGIDGLADPPADLVLLRGNGLIGRRVLTDAGVDLGPLDDVGLDPATGALTELVLADGRVLPADGLLGLGNYATVVRADSAVAP